MRDHGGEGSKKKAYDFLFLDHPKKYDCEVFQEMI